MLSTDTFFKNVTNFREYIYGQERSIKHLKKMLSDSIAEGIDFDNPSLAAQTRYGNIMTRIAAREETLAKCMTEYEDIYWKIEDALYEVSKRVTRKDAVNVVREKFLAGKSVEDIIALHHMSSSTVWRCEKECFAYFKVPEVDWAKIDAIMNN